MGVSRNGAALQLPANAAALSQRDRALAVEISSGTIRYRGYLDFLLKTCMPQPPAAKHHFLWAVLHTALYQALFMRIPERAAVNEAVTLIKESREKPRSGFVNAVLRAVLRQDRGTLLEKISDPVQRLAVEYAYPEWLVTRWYRTIGAEKTRQRLIAGNQVAPLTLRCNRLATQPERLLASLGAGARRCTLAPHGILFDAATGPVEKIPGFGNGWFAVQDQAAQLVCQFVNPQPGERVLDACAAPGGKTAYLAAMADIKITAVEKDPARITRMEENLDRLRAKNVEILVGDASDSNLLDKKCFDRALVDAPCTGTGIIRRHPEIKWRRSAADIRRMAEIQANILTSVAQKVVLGGWLIYATCSLEPEENRKQIRHST